MLFRIRPNPVASYYWRRVRAYPKALSGVLLAVPLSVLINGYLPPLILASVLSRLSQHHFHPHRVWESFGTILLAYAGLMLLGTLLWRVVDFFVWRLEANVGQDIAEDVFRHMIHESADFHANNFSGSLVSQNNKLLAGYVRVADTVIFQTYPMIAGLIIATVILSTRAPLYVLVLLGVTILFLVTAYYVSRSTQRLSQIWAEAESRQTGFLADAITNIMAIKSFAGGRYEQQRFHAATSHTKQKLKRFARRQQFQITHITVLNRLMSVLALVMAVVSVVVFDANIATVFLIFSYTSTIADQLFQFSNSSLRNYSRSFGDAAEMVHKLRQTPAIEDPAQPETVAINKGEIHFDDVWFTHTGADDTIFEGLDLKINAGEKIGLVGHSGSGKTTLTRLLLRFSNIDKGAISIDGQNIAHITQDDLHRHIAYVPQEPLLFHRSLRENIAYGKVNASDDEVERAAHLSHAAEFIDGLPDGYDTLVGERGVKLSGGQRQRVAIARAMLKNAPLLVLDEATSALDSESEVLIQDALWKLMEGRTAIVIAHRLSTIQKMDRIIVLDNGKIVEQGTHQQLLRKNGTYAKLWAHQSGGFIDD